MPKGKVILPEERFSITMERLCHQLIEEFNDFTDTCVIGIQPRGIALSDRIVDQLKELGVGAFPYGKLDITFYRDDFRTKKSPIFPHTNDINFIVDDKRVLLVDDVLYTGRTIQAALSALQQYGRPKNVELLTLVDRRFNRHLPIQADYVGMTVDSMDEAYVKVEWSEADGKDQILLYPHKV